MAERPFVYRFTKDLRLDDHAGLAAAAARGAVIPLLVICSSTSARLRRSPRRAAYFCAAVAALDAELRERGSALVVRRGEPADAIVSVARAAQASGVAWSAGYDGAAIERDRALQMQLEEQGLAALIVHDAPAVPPDETAAARSGSGVGYRAFAPYFDAWCAAPVASYEYPLLLRFAATTTSSQALPSPGEFDARECDVAAGAVAARRTLERFLREDAPHYAAAATDPANDRTSHLSAHLSFGTISGRAVARAAAVRLNDPFAIGEERLSVRLFLRAFAHRDFFFQLAWFHPETGAQALQEKMRDFQWAQTHPALEAWREGATGYPLVDAGVRQLRATGWMHPHVRAVAASFLCFDLGVDWRIGVDEWDRWLIEDDEALACGNWQWIAGVGADMAQYPRIYNPERQRRRYDPAGAYVRRWIGELAHVPLDRWYGRPSQSRQLALALEPAPAYAKPVVDHGLAARNFLRRYRQHASKA